MVKPIIEENINRDNCLFLHNDVYTYKIYNEYTIVAFYLGITNISNEAMYVINNCNDDVIMDTLFSNLKFYNNSLISKNSSKIVKDFNSETYVDINGENVKFTSSSSSLVPHKDGGYIMNVRYVNYTIGKKGEYYGCDNHIITQNKMVRQHKSCFDIDEEMYIPLNYTNKKYIGIEDIKLFKYNDKLLFIGTVLKEDGTLGMATGEYDYSRELVYTELTQNFNKTKCEKNWVYVNFQNELCIIYDWSPLRICSLNGDEVKIKEEKIMPPIYKYVRGSTCGFEYGNEIWFVSHISHYSSPREYYHIISVFDKNMKLLRYSAPFKFDGQSIEFCLSIVVEEDKVIINYSTWDRTTNIEVFNKEHLEQSLRYTF
jgi:hypothetical protein